MKHSSLLTIIMHSKALVNNRDIDRDAEASIEIAD